VNAADEWPDTDAGKERARKRCQLHVLARAHAVNGDAERLPHERMQFAEYVLEGQKSIISRVSPRVNAGTRSVLRAAT
jgi:hypothetical protein